MLPQLLLNIYTYIYILDKLLLEFFINIINKKEIGYCESGNGCMSLPLVIKRVAHIQCVT